MIGARGRRRSGAHHTGGGGGFSNTDTTPPALGGGTGCRLYCAAAHGLYTDAGITLATSATQAIKRWKDYSGNNNHLEQPDAIQYPTAGTAAQLIFDSTATSGQCFEAPAAVITSVTDGELFGLIKLDSQPQSGLRSGALWQFGGNDLGFYADTGSGGSIFEGSGTSTRYSFSAPSGLTSWHVYSVRTSGTDWDALKNNTPISGAARTGNTAFWNNGLRVGADTTEAAFLKGQLAAVVFYDGARSAPERASIVAALLAQSPP